MLTAPRLTSGSGRRTVGRPRTGGSQFRYCETERPKRQVTRISLGAQQLQTVRAHYVDVIHCSAQPAAQEAFSIDARPWPLDGDPLGAEVTPERGAYEQAPISEQAPMSETGERHQAREGLAARGSHPTQRDRIKGCYLAAQPLSDHRHRGGKGGCGAVDHHPSAQQDAPPVQQHRGREHDERSPAMIIERDALLLAAMVTITAAISIVGLFSLGVAALTAHRRSDTMREDTLFEL